MLAAIDFDTAEKRPRKGSNTGLIQSSQLVIMLDPAREKGSFEVPTHIPSEIQRFTALPMCSLGIHSWLIVAICATYAYGTTQKRPGGGWLEKRNLLLSMYMCTCQ